MSKRRDLPISLEMLRGFEVAARRLSFTAAASELFLTQSAVSRQVLQLEARLGVKLFERRTRALRLTPAGALYAREVSRALDQLREAAALVRARPAPVVRVACSVAFAALWLVPRLAQFQNAQPGVVVHLAADNAIATLQRQAADVAIRYCPPALAGPGAEQLFGEHIAPVASPALLKGRRFRTAADVLQLPLLELADPNGAAPWLTWKVWCEVAKVERPRESVGLVFSQYDQVIQAAVAGQGVAIGRFPLVDKLLAARKLLLPLRDSSVTTDQGRAYWLLVASAARKRTEVTAFTDWLRSQVAS